MTDMDEIVDSRVVADFCEITEQCARHASISLQLNSVTDSNAAGMRNHQLGTKYLPNLKSFSSDHNARMNYNIRSNDRSLKNNSPRSNNCPVSNLHIALCDE